jgi:hypothetical protein
MRTTLPEYYIGEAKDDPRVAEEVGYLIEGITDPCEWDRLSGELAATR